MAGRSKTLFWSQVGYPNKCTVFLLKDLISVQTFNQCQNKISFDGTKKEDVILQNLRASMKAFHNWRVLVVTEEDKEKIKA